MTNTSNTFGNLAPQLHAMGYSVLPLDGKAPRIKQWSELPITPQQIDQWAAEKPTANIGLRCDQALMVDIDIDDLAEAPADDGADPGPVPRRADTATR